MLKLVILHNWEVELGKFNYARVPSAASTQAREPSAEARQIIGPLSCRSSVGFVGIFKGSLIFFSDLKMVV